MNTQADLDLLNLAYRYARRIGLCREDAQDCAQDFLVRLLAQPAAHRDSPAWLSRCAHNFACNYYRTLARSRAREIRAAELSQSLGRPSGLTSAASFGPRTLVMQRDFWSQVRSLLALFTRDQQELFVCYHLRHQSLADLAARDGRSIHALHQSLHNVRRRLAALLIERGWSASDVRQLFGAKPPQPPAPVRVYSR